MTYINGNDMPEHVKRIITDVVTGKSKCTFTTNKGHAVAISKEEYDNLVARASGADVCSSHYRGMNLDRELEGFYRDEVDF